MPPETPIPMIFSFSADRGGWRWKPHRDPLPAGLIALGEMPGFSFWISPEDREADGLEGAIAEFKEKHAPLICLDKRILVVDDEVGALALCSIIFGRYGLAVETTPNPKTGLEMLDAGAFDVLLLDDLMPEMDGVEMTRRIRANPRWARLPVVMFGAHSGAGFLASAWEAGIDAHVRKPIRIPDLLIPIAELVRNGRKAPGLLPEQPG